MNQFGKLLCSHCLNSFMNFAFCMNICTSFVMNIWFEYRECSLTKISYYLQVLWLSHLKLLLYLYNNELTGTLPTEMGNMKLSKLICTHCINTLMEFEFFMTISIYLFYEYMIWIWRVLTDKDIPPVASLVTISFWRLPKSVK